MFSFIKNKNILLNINTQIKPTSQTHIYTTIGKSFAQQGKWNLYKFRRDTSSYYLRDFTKGGTAQRWMTEEITKQKSKLKTEKLSSLLQQEDRRKLKHLNPYFKPNKIQFNKYIRKSAIKQINVNESKDFNDLAMKLFVQDHTAQVLENIRKLKENKIFNRKMHEVKEKKLAMKFESRKPENIIENYDQKFLNYQNYNDHKFDSNKSYDLLNFLPEGRRTIGVNLNEPNYTNTKLKSIESQYVVNNKFMEYENNKKQLSNLRIESMLSNRKNNEALQKYLLEDNNKGGRNLIENSNSNKISNEYSQAYVDLNLENGQSQNNQISNGVSSLSSTLNKTSNEISNENVSLLNSLRNYFQPHIELTTKIQQYEIEVYNEYKKLDLYAKYHKGIVQFGDMTLEENLNYIKFNIKNSAELFKMYKEIIHKDFTKYHKENIQNQPAIFSAILQKFALGVKTEESAITLLSDFDYKNLLRDIKTNLAKISDKNIVDNIWSVAKLHGRNRIFSPVFFQHFLNELITEVSVNRVENLSFEALSFLTEGLDFLKINTHNDDDTVVDNFQVLNEKIYNRIIDICNNDALLVQFHPFNLAKILNYFYNLNLDIDKFHVMLNGLGRPLKEFIKTNEVSLCDIMDRKDLVKIVKAYSWGIVKAGISGKKNEIYFRSEVIGEDQGKLTIKEYNDEEENLEEFLSTIPARYEFNSVQGVKFYKEVLIQLSNPILIKNKQLEIYHCTNFLYHYSNANIYDSTLFRQLSLQITDKLEKVEDFKLEDVLYFTYGMSKYYTKKIFPYFFHDVMNIIYPNLNEKSTSYKYLILNKFKNRLFEKNDTLHIQNLSLICYTSSLMGFSDIDFYLPVYHNIILADKEFSRKKINNQLPAIKLGDIGYLMQSLSLLNFNDEYILEYFISKFFTFINQSVNIQNETDDYEYKYKLNVNLNHFSLSQILAAIVNLSARKYYREIANWRTSIEKIKHYVLANFENEDFHNSVSVLWFLSYFEIFDDKIFDHLHRIINDNKDKLRKYESIVLNQIIVYNYIKNEYIFKELTKDHVENLNSLSKDFEKERLAIQKKISLKDKYQDLSFVEKVQDVLKKNEKELLKDGYGYIENFTVANSYTIPIYFPKGNLFVLFYDHTERMKDKNVNGYNSIKEDILYSLGYKIERIYAYECDDIMDSNDKILDLIIKKIK